jgi:hypothetical protein
MGRELVWEDVMMRVEGDIFELFSASASGRRTPLRWLVVWAEPLRDNRVQVTVGHKSYRQIVENVDLPLYAWGKPDGAYPGLVFGIDADSEPAFRAFFAEAAQVCGRSVAQVGGS